jgi:hypothetical protein
MRHHTEDLDLISPPLSRLSYLVDISARIKVLSEHMY